MKRSSDKKADYGLYSMNYVVFYMILGVALLVLCIVDFKPFVIYIVITLYLVWATKKGRFIECEKLLDTVQIRSDDTVLDIGCGRGLFLINAAKRLTVGKAFGVDIWNQNDQSGNDPKVTLQNAIIENVSERVEVRNGDARKLPFDDDSFSVVISSLAIHNIKKQEERNRVAEEIIRVLKPQGRFAILDIHNVNEYADVLRKLGATEIEVIGPHFRLFPPVKIVTGKMN